MAVQAIPGSTPLATGHDRCPFARPFPPDFNDCPAYQQSTFTAADSNNHLLGDHLTCRHLGVGRNTVDRGGFYGRCNLGSRADRLRWVAEMRPERLEAIQAISAELEELNAGRRPLLFEAKSRVLAAPSETDPRKQLKELADEYLAALRGFIATHDRELTAVGLPGDQLVELIADMLRRWTRTRDMAAVAPDPGLLARFDGPVRMLLGGATRRADEWPEAEPYAEEAPGDMAPLQVIVTPDSRALRVTGHVDAATTDAFGAAVTAALSTGTREVDMSGVISCDAAGMRALVSAAAELPEGEQLLVSGLSPHLQKVMRSAGWSDSGKLRIDPVSPA